MTVIIAAIIIGAGLVMAGALIQQGLVKVSEAFGWNEQTTYTDLDKLLAERLQAENEEWDEDNLVLYDSSSR